MNGASSRGSMLPTVNAPFRLRPGSSMKTPDINKVIYSQRGFTLIELLVALTITIVVMSGVVQVLTVSKSNFVTGRELAMSQENARYAMKFITDEIRMGGFTGCTSKPLSVVNTINGAKNSWYLS